MEIKKQRKIKTTDQNENPAQRLDVQFPPFSQVLPWKHHSRK